MIFLKELQCLDADDRLPGRTVVTTMVTRATCSIGWHFKQILFISCNREYAPREETPMSLKYFSSDPGNVNTRIILLSYYKVALSVQMDIEDISTTSTKYRYFYPHRPNEAFIVSCLPLVRNCKMPNHHTRNRPWNTNQQFLRYPRNLSDLSTVAALSSSHVNVLVSYILVQHIEAETKWPPFRRRHFQTHFLEWKY